MMKRILNYRFLLTWSVFTLCLGVGQVVFGQYSKGQIRLKQQGKFVDSLQICEDEFTKQKIFNIENGFCSEGDTLYYCWIMTYDSLFPSRKVDTIDIGSIGMIELEKLDVTYYKGPGKYKFYRILFCGETECGIYNDNATTVTLMVSGSLVIVPKVNGYVCSDSKENHGASIIIENAPKNLKYVLKYKNILDTAIYTQNSIHIFDKIRIDSIGTYTIQLGGDSLKYYCNIPVLNVTVSELKKPIIEELESFLCDGEKTPIHLNGIQSKVIYKLYKDSTVIDSVFADEEGRVHFDVTIKGKYYVGAVDTFNRGCIILSDTIQVYYPEIDTSIQIKTSAPYCTGTTDSLTLDSSQVGKLYVLKKENIVIDSLYGTNSALTFEIDTDGIYTVLVKDTFSRCEVNLPNNVIVKYIHVKDSLGIDKSGLYCEGSNGKQIQLKSSQPNAVYTLLYKGSPVNDEITAIGSGPLDFGYYTREGVYKIEADSGGCTRILSDSIVVKSSPIPAYTMSFTDAKGNVIDSTCQYSDAVNLKVQFIQGIFPMVMDLDFQLRNNYNINDSIFTMPLETLNPGTLSATIKSVKDSLQCTNNQISKKEIKIKAIPNALISPVVFPVKEGELFSMDGKNSTVNQGGATIMTYEWQFWPQIKVDGNLEETIRSQTLDKMSLFNPLNHLFSLKVTDSNGCTSMDYVSHNFGPSFCVRDTTIQICHESDSSTYTLKLDSFNIIGTFCPSCKVDYADATLKKLRLSLYGLKSNRTIKVPILVIGLPGCAKNYALVTFDISSSKYEVGSVALDTSILCLQSQETNYLVCKDIKPAEGISVLYQINAEKPDTINVTNGQIRIPLPNQLKGQNNISLLEVLNNRNLMCGAPFETSFSYVVQECRIPEPQLSSAILAENAEVCLNQSGITLQYTDTNASPDGFTIKNSDITWKVLVNNNLEIKDVLQVTKQSGSETGYLYLDKNKFRAGDNVMVITQVSRQYTNPEGTFPASDTFRLRISNQLSPDRGEIRRYPGNVFYYNASGLDQLCTRWAYIDVATDPIDWKKEIAITSNTNPRLSNSGRSVFGDDLFVSKLENKENGVLKPGAYLWVDAWPKPATGTCQYQAGNCYARTYYNAANPPKGAPRVADELSMAVFPNPSQGGLQFWLEGDYKGTIKGSVSDYLGRPVMELNQMTKDDAIFQQNLDLSRLPAGSYLLKISGNGISAVSPFIIIH